MSDEPNVEAWISKQARERAKKDNFVRSNKKKYNNEIAMIILSGGIRPVELIGDFLVSPRGHVKHRVAWHKAFDQKANILVIYIDDLLYHVTEEDYVGYWNSKARERRISLSSYNDYQPWAGF